MLFIKLEKKLNVLILMKNKLNYIFLLNFDKRHIQIRKQTFGITFLYNNYIQ